MSWVAYDKAYVEPKTAKDDMLVIKFLLKNSNGDLISPFAHYKYELGKQTEKISLFVDTFFSPAYSIRLGYHSFEYPKKIKEKDTLSFADCLLHYSRFSKKKTVVWTKVYNSEAPYVCVIPKGAQYYLNDKHEIVSETIIAKEPFMYQWETIENK